MFYIAVFIKYMPYDYLCYVAVILLATLFVEYSRIGLVLELFRILLCQVY